MFLNKFPSSHTIWYDVCRTIKYMYLQAQIQAILLKQFLQKNLARKLPPAKITRNVASFKIVLLWSLNL